MIFSKRKDKTIEGLESILLAIEPDEQLGRTLVELYKTFRAVSRECSNPLNSLHYRDEKGLLAYVNYQAGSPLHVNGKNATFFREVYSIFEPSGKKLIREQVGEDGAIELLNDGRMPSGRRKLDANDYDKVAVQKGVIKEGEEVSAVQLGYDEKARKKKPFTKHYGGMTATGIDSKVYIMIQSSTGDIVLLHDYKIVFSTILSEIHPTYRQYLASDINPNKGLKQKAGITYHHVHGAGVISL